MTEVTQLLNRALEGNPHKDKLFTDLYQELRRLAHNRLKQAANPGMLDTTAISPLPWESATALCAASGRRLACCCSRRSIEAAPTADAGLISAMPLRVEDLAALSALLDEALDLPLERRGAWLDNLAGPYEHHAIRCGALRRARPDVS